MKIFQSLIIFLILSFQINAQDGYQIIGNVFNISGEPEIGAEIELFLNDSSITSTYSDENGYFELNNISNGEYSLKLESLGLVPIIKMVEINNGNFDLGNLSFEAKKEILEDVIVRGEVIAVKQDGDTTVFNANAYKTNPDATTEDLIRKMPGVDLSDGSPKAQGENITKVLVDGKPFFGDDVNATLRNLPAEVVSGVQIYDERSEQSQMSGFDDGQTTKTLNIITREDKREGIFGKLYGGYGFPDDHYYNLGGVMNFFKGNQRLTLLGQSNNINIQNFSSEDLGGGSGGGGRGGRGGGGARGGSGGSGGGNSDMMVTPKNGITQTHALGLNYSNVWKDKIKLSGSYFFNNSKNNSIETIERNFISLENAGQRYREENQSNTDEFSHRLNARLEYQIDSSNYLSFSPSLRIQKLNGLSSMVNNNFINESKSISQTINTYTTESESLNASYRLLYNHSFKKKGRTISLSNNSGFNYTKGKNNLNATNIFEDPINNYILDQESNITNNGWNTYANLNYTEPITKDIKGQINAGLRYQETSSDKKTYDYNGITNEYTDINTRLSNEFVSKYLTKFAGLAFAYNKNSINFNVGANYQQATLDNERILPIQGNLSNEFNNVLPFLSFTKEFNKGTSLRVRYFTSTNTPSVNQLQDVIDNSNTTILRTGNPDLDQNYEHRIFANYRTSNPKNNSNFFIMVMANIVNDYIGNSTIVANENMVVDGYELNRGMQFIKPVNLDGYYNIFSHMSYGFRIKPIKSNLNITTAIGQTNTPGLINNELNKAKTNTLSLGLNLSSNISENIDFNISSRSSYSKVNNTLTNNPNNSFFNQNSRLDINYILPLGLFANSQLNHQYFQGLGSDFNQNYLLWNLSLGYKFLKNRNAEIKLSVYDLLNQNQAVGRTFTDIYTQDATTNVLRQYFMVTFTYNIRAFKGKSSEKDFEMNGPSGMQRGPGELPAGHPPAR